MEALSSTRTHQNLSAEAIFQDLEQSEHYADYVALLQNDPISAECMQRGISIKARQIQSEELNNEY